MKSIVGRSVVRTFGTIALAGLAFAGGMVFDQSVLPHWHRRDEAVSLDSIDDAGCHGTYLPSLLFHRDEVAESHPAEEPLELKCGEHLQMKNSWFVCSCGLRRPPE